MISVSLTLVLRTFKRLDQCYAQIANATFKFVCPVDECTSTVRLNRCKFDCDNEEIWESDI